MRSPLNKRTVRSTRPASSRCSMNCSDSFFRYCERRNFLHFSRLHKPEASGGRDNGKAFGVHNRSGHTTTAESTVGGSRARLPQLLEHQEFAMDRSHPTPRAREKPVHLQARERESHLTRRCVNPATKSFHALSSARFPAGTLASQAALQVAALTPQGNAAPEDRVRCGLAPKRRFACDGCNAPQVVVSH